MILKKITALIFSLCIIAAPTRSSGAIKEYDSTTLFLPAAMSLNDARSKTKILAWSHHKVLTKTDDALRSQINLEYAPVLGFNWSAYAFQKAYALVAGVEGNHIKAVKEINALPAECAGEAHAQILDKYGFTTVAACVRALASAKKINEPALSIVRDLHGKLEQYFCTNDGLTTLDAICKKAREAGSDFSKLLNKGMTTSYGTYNQPLSYLDVSQFKTTHQYTYQEAFFHDFTKYFNARRTNLVVFISSSQNAVNYAVKAGCIGILYITSEQTRNDLRLIGIESE